MAPEDVDHGPAGVAFSNTSLTVIEQSNDLLQLELIRQDVNRARYGAFEGPLDSSSRDRSGQ